MDPRDSSAPPVSRPDRRTRNLGPPKGHERRTAAAGRRATDALKMACPFCGGSESSVVRSRGAITDDKVRRRRECAECAKRFPTSERVDQALLDQELAAGGQPTLFALRDDPPLTWDHTEALLHQLWGQAKTAQYDKRRWEVFHRMFMGLKKAS